MGAGNLAGILSTETNANAIMSRFPNWTTQAAEAADRDRLSKRLDRQAKVVRPKETANRITANIIRVINLQPKCIAYRINNVGVWDAAKGIHRKGNTEKGIPDISAIVRGRALWVEVKAGRDKMSEDQLMRKMEIERSGGLFFEARSTDEFLVFFRALLAEI